MRNAKYDGGVPGKPMPIPEEVFEGSRPAKQLPPESTPEELCLDNCKPARRVQIIDGIERDIPVVPSEEYWKNRKF